MAAADEPSAPIPSSGSSPSEECRLDVAALVERITHSSAIGWRLTAATGPQPARARARRYGRTLIGSELAAVEAGLREASRIGCRRLQVQVAEPLTVRILNGEGLARYRRAARTAARLRPLLDRFQSVRFVIATSEDPELRQAVGDALDLGLHRAAERDELRTLVLEQVIERAKEVHLERKGDDWVANGRYRVRLDPMHCECPAWSKRWARAQIAGRRAQRLPCKHLVALALDEGISDPQELLALARKAAD